MQFNGTKREVVFYALSYEFENDFYCSSVSMNFCKR